MREPRSLNRTQTKGVRLGSPLLPNLIKVDKNFRVLQGARAYARIVATDQGGFVMDSNWLITLAIFLFMLAVS